MVDIRRYDELTQADLYDLRHPKKHPVDIKDSVALQRIIDEVRNGDGVPTGYNRVYHRHNR